MILPDPLKVVFEFPHFVCMNQTAFPPPDTVVCPLRHLEQRERSLVMLSNSETSSVILNECERSLRFFAKAQNDGEETLRITGEGKKNFDSPDGEKTLSDASRQRVDLPLATRPQSGSQEPAPSKGMREMASLRFAKCGLELPHTTDIAGFAHKISSMVEGSYHLPVAEIHVPCPIW